MHQQYTYPEKERTACSDDLGIRIVPLTVRFGGEELVDRLDLTPAEFWARCAVSPVLPETAAPAPGQFEQTYRSLADGRRRQHRRRVAVAAPLGRDAERAARRPDVRREAHGRGGRLPLGQHGSGDDRRRRRPCARDGGGLEDVAALARDLADRTHVWGVLDDLDHLRRGGRIGAPRALLASALAIKPIIEIRDGRVEEGGRQRTRTKAMRSLVDRVAAAGPLEALAVLHAETPDVDDFVAQLAPLAPGPLMVTDIGAVIGAHCGPGAIGVAYQTKLS